MDRLSAMSRKKPMNIPVLDVQKQSDENYQEQIENMHLQLLEQEDATRLSRELADRWEKRNEELHARVKDYQSVINERNTSMARATTLESDVKRLESDLRTEVGNRDHFRQLVAQQDAFIKESKRQIEQYKLKRDAELKSKETEAEHLAKQAIRLNEENSKLLKENTENVSRNNILNNQTPLLMEENRKYREQTTRLIDEKRKLTEQLSNLDCQAAAPGSFTCGGCLNCQLRQSEHGTNKIIESLRFEKSITSYKDSIITILRTALDALKAMPCLTWRTQGKVYRDCMNTVSALQGNIDNLREQQQK
jgi:hypothetical protein